MFWNKCQSYAITAQAGRQTDRRPAMRMEFARINSARHNAALGGVVSETRRAARLPGMLPERGKRDRRSTARRGRYIPADSFSHWARLSRTSGDSSFSMRDRARRATSGCRSAAHDSSSFEAAPVHPAWQALPPCSTSRAEVPARGWRIEPGTASGTRSYVYSLRRTNRGQAP